MVHQQMGHLHGLHNDPGDHLTWIPEQAGSITVQDHSNTTATSSSTGTTNTTIELSNNEKENTNTKNVDGLLSVPSTTIATSGSSDTLTGTQEYIILTIYQIFL